MTHSIFIAIWMKLIQLKETELLINIKICILNHSNGVKMLTFHLIISMIVFNIGIINLKEITQQIYHRFLNLIIQLHNTLSKACKNILIRNKIKPKVMYFSNIQDSKIFHLQHLQKSNSLAQEYARQDFFIIVEI